MQQVHASEEWLASLPEDRQASVRQLRDTVAKALPAGFEEACNSNMIHFVVPHSLYPAGYHCNPKQPLPFISIGNTKGHITLHHLGLYSSPELLQWFQETWPEYANAKLEMGKGCVKFKKPESIPFELIKAVAQKFTPQEWIATYESLYKKGQQAEKN